MSDVYYLILDKKSNCSDLSWCGTRIRAIQAVNFTEAEQRAKSFLQEKDFFSQSGLDDARIAIACSSIPFGKWKEEHEAEKAAKKLTQQKITPSR